MIYQFNIIFSTISIPPFTYIIFLILTNLNLLLENEFPGLNCISEIIYIFNSRLLKCLNLNKMKNANNQNELCNLIILGTE